MARANNKKSVSFFSRTHPSVNSATVIVSGDDSGESGSKNVTNDSSNDDYDPKRTREQRSPQKSTSQKRSRHLRKSPSEEPSHIDRITAHTQEKSDLLPPRGVLKQFKGWFGL